MKRREKAAGKILDEFFGRVPRSSPGEMEDAYPRLWDRLWVEARALPPKAERETALPQHANPYRLVLASVAAITVLLVGGLTYREILERRGVSAMTAIDVLQGKLYHLDGMRMIDLGARVQGGEVLHSDGGAIFQLADGSHVEVRPKSELKVEGADDGVSIQLNRGSVLITAAKQPAGHLYVQTRDLKVAVVGTVFLVNAEEPGSRVAVIEGEVRVEREGKSQTLAAGQQLKTNALMSLLPVPQEISWSLGAETHVALLQQSVPPAVAAVKPLQFEVARLRPGEQTWPPEAIECRGIDGVWSMSSDLSLNPIARPAVAPSRSTVPLGRCVGSAFLRAYLGAAYDVRMDRISGDESKPWFYQLDAKADDPTTATVDQLRQMLRNLVIAEFKPKVYRETKEIQGYLLTLGKDGPKYKEASGEEEMRNPRAGPADSQGRAGMIMEGRYRMVRFANSLAGSAGRPVIDRTGLSGIYDISLTLYPVPPLSTAGGLRGGSNITAPEFDPPLSEALAQQLGLRLEPTKLPADFLVVQQVERPN
jgi:uncharacterized protein (TIGR03435 family)